MFVPIPCLTPLKSPIPPITLDFQGPVTQRKLKVSVLLVTPTIVVVEPYPGFGKMAFIALA